MITKQVENLTFHFPDDWLVEQYDEWPTYKHRFKDACGGNKAIDLAAISPANRTLWLIEVKDYRRFPRKKALEIADEISIKVRDSLAGLVATRFLGDEPERKYATRSLKMRRLRVVFHLEQPVKPSKLFPRPYELADVQQKLRQKVRAIDPHALVVDTSDLTRVTWNVTSTRRPQP